MAKRGKGKSRPPKLAPFESEEDADQIFLDYVENMGDVPESERSIPDSVPLERLPSKAKSKGRSQKSSTSSIDLHGMTLAEAKQAVDRFLAEALHSLQGEKVVKIITGKGRHSGPDGAVLPGGVHAHVKGQWRRFIVRIDDSPENVAIAGLPIRGHFDVTLKK